MEISLSRSDCTYTSCYCEENIYKLIERLGSGGHGTSISLDSLYAVFISNNSKQVR